MRYGTCRAWYIGQYVRNASYVREMAAVLQGSDTEILAASLKSTEEAVAALQAGAHHITIPLSLLKAMTFHELSADTVADCAHHGQGIKYQVS